MTMTAGYAGPIKLVLFDVDGVLTDGTLYLDGAGEAIKSFNVKDGLAVALLRAHGIQSGVLSGKQSAPLDYRIGQLGFDHAVTGSLDKVAALQSVLETTRFSREQVVFVGDDVVDLQLIGRVARFFAPSDAHPLVLGQADDVIAMPGGSGVAREVAERVLTDGGLSLEQAYAPLIQSWSSSDAVQ